MTSPQIIDLRNEARQVPTTYEGGIIRHNPFPEGGDVSVRLLKFTPGASTHRHNHTEIEFWTVIAGGVRIHMDGGNFLLLTGESVRVEPLQSHRIEALDSGAVMQTVWWHSRRNFEETAGARGNNSDREVMIVPAMLTPNGRMHIGHAAGPFLYADILSRIAKAAGRASFVVQGTHGHLEHIRIAAEAANMDYYHLAERNTSSFRESLSRLKAEPDVFIGTEPDERGRAVVLEVFERLFEKGLIVEREHSVPYDPDTGRFVVDAFVHGECPHCGGYSSGTECEDCGALVLDADLGNPVDLGGKPLEKRALKRLFLNLASLHSKIESFVSQEHFPLHSRLYVDSWLERGLPEVCVTNLNGHGINVPLPGFQDQRFNVVMEYVPRHLLALESIRESRGQPARWYQLKPSELPELNILFGADNSFGRLLVIPAVLAALDLEQLLPRRVYANSMLTLDGLKLSTSRNHAIWINDFVTPENAEAFRFYLCRCRPEGVPEDFTVGSFEKWKSDFWETELASALRNGGHVIRRVTSAELPGPGQWSASEIELLATCKYFNDGIRADFEAPYPDIRRITRTIETFVNKIDRYFATSLHVPAPSKGNEALERTAARMAFMALASLSVALFPITPDFAASILSRLGLPTSPNLDWLGRDWMSEQVNVSGQL